MFKLIKQSILKNKQNAISKRYPGVKMVLHPEMPSPSMNKMVEVAKIVAAVNSWEEKVSGLSDEQLKSKTSGFKEHIRKKSEVYQRDIEDLEEQM